MKSILISIKPQWCEKIVSGEKTIEVRKSAPKEVPLKAYIYATMPKRFYKCGAVNTSDELLWLANGKIEMCDGFKFWADGDEYQNLNGKVIGEFICDKVDKYTAEFVDNDCYEDIRRIWIDDDGEEDFEIVTSNDRDNPEDCELLKKSCLTYAELKNYIGANFHDIPFYGLHISDLKIYDKPKELSEFRKPCPYSENMLCNFCLKSGYLPNMEIGCFNTITRPPLSWCYVEELIE